jgi:hypothetical protein
MVTGSLQVVKRPKRGADHPLRSSAGVGHGRAIPVPPLKAPVLNVSGQMYVFI